MLRNRFNPSQWLRNNWLELILLLLLLLALAWIFGTSRSLLQLSQPEPTPVPTATRQPVRTDLPAASTLVPPTAVLPGLFDGRQALGYVAAQTALGPRPSGTAANAATADFIAAKLAELGWAVRDRAVEPGPPEFAPRNVVAEAGQGPLVILATHYDTRATADRETDPARQGLPSLGANDGASGVAVLLELARVIDRALLEKTVILAFLDGEASGDPRTWSFGPGAAAFYGSLPTPPEAVIVLNMVGGSDQTLYWERTSDPMLRQVLWDEAARLGFTPWFVPEERFSVDDDPTLASALPEGVPVVNIIDLDYPYWHTLNDIQAQLSADSLERVGRVLQAFVEAVPIGPAAN